MKKQSICEARPALPDGSPAVSIEEKLVAEVQRLEERLEAARDDLRRWRLSRGSDIRSRG